MVEQPVVVVRGEATRQVPPEQALVSVTASVRDQDRPAALARLTARTAEVRAVLDEFAEAIERRETGGVSLYPEQRRRGEKAPFFAGRITTTAVVTDFTVLGTLLLRLGGLTGTEVHGPWWQLRPGSTAGADVRKAAISDALGRAVEYADAVGARVDRLIEISDEGTGGGGPMFRAVAAGGRESADGDLQLDLEPEEQTVHASVVVRVAITEPTTLLPVRRRAHPPIGETRPHAETPP